MKQNFFPFVWNSDVTHQLRRHQIHTSVSLKWHEYTIRNFWNSCNTGISSCRFLHKCVEANQCQRIFALRTSEMPSAVLDPSNSNEQRRLFLLRLDHDDPTSLMTNFEILAGRESHVVRRNFELRSMSFLVAGLLQLCRTRFTFFWIRSFKK